MREGQKGTAMSEARVVVRHRIFKRPPIPNRRTSGKKLEYYQFGNLGKGETYAAFQTFGVCGSHSAGVVI
jgi:hypothetical protein